MLSMKDEINSQRVKIEEWENEVPDAIRIFTELITQFAMSKETFTDIARKLIKPQISENYSSSPI